MSKNKDESEEIFDLEILSESPNSNYKPRKSMQPISPRYQDPDDPQKPLTPTKFSLLSQIYQEKERNSLPNNPHTKYGILNMIQLLNGISFQWNSILETHNTDETELNLNYLHLYQNLSKSIKNIKGILNSEERKVEENLKWYLAETFDQEGTVFDKNLAFRSELTVNQGGKSIIYKHRGMVYRNTEQGGLFSDHHGFIFSYRIKSNEQERLRIYYHSLDATSRFAPAPAINHLNFVAFDLQSQQKDIIEDYGLAASLTQLIESDHPHVIIIAEYFGRNESIMKILESKGYKVKNAKIEKGKNVPEVNTIICYEREKDFPPLIEVTSHLNSFGNHIKIYDKHLNLKLVGIHVKNDSATPQKVQEQMEDDKIDCLFGDTNIKSLSKFKPPFYVLTNKHNYNMLISQILTSNSANDHLYDTIIIKADNDGNKGHSRDIIKSRQQHTINMPPPLTSTSSSVQNMLPINKRRTQTSSTVTRRSERLIGKPPPLTSTSSSVQNTLPINKRRTQTSSTSTVTRRSKRLIGKPLSIGSLQPGTNKSDFEI